MKTIKINDAAFDIPRNFTGIADRFDGTKMWYLNGKLHRTDGPAIEHLDGDKFWYLNGEFHRIDGPAIECSDGDKEYWLNDEVLDEDKIDQLVKKFNYPIETAIKLAYYLEMNQS